MPERKSEARSSQAPKLQIVSGTIAERLYDLSSGMPQQKYSTARVAFDRAELNLLLIFMERKLRLANGGTTRWILCRAKQFFQCFAARARFPCIELKKIPELARRLGVYAVLNAGEQILRRGHQLDRVLRVFETKFKVINGE